MVHKLGSTKYYGFKISKVTHHCIAHGELQKVSADSHQAIRKDHPGHIGRANCPDT